MVGHRRDHLGHLKRGHLQLVLSDAHAPDIGVGAARVQQRELSVLEAVLAAGGHLRGRVVELRLVAEAEAAHVAGHDVLAEPARPPGPRPC